MSCRYDRFTPVFDSGDSAPPSPRIAYRSSPRLPRRPSPPSAPHRFLDPPRLHVRHTLSPDAATRLMLEKWDLMDALAPDDVGDGWPTDPRGRTKRKGRASLMPSERRRAMSRVREYEMWEPEREKIRLAQVEMERRLDEEKKAVVLSDDEVDAAVDKPKRRRRKATPAVLVSAPTSDVEWDNEGRRSVLSSMASAGSPPPLVDKHNRRPDERGQFESAHHRARRDPSRRRSIRSVPSEDTRGSATDRRSSRKERRPLSPSLEPSDHRPPRSRSARASSLPAQAHINNYERATHSRSREEDVSDTPAFPTRSSRRRPSRSRRSTASPTPIETPRSPGKAASPASSVEEDHKGSGAGDFLDAAAGAVEQVSEAVSSALSRMLPGLFSNSSNSSMG